MRRILGALAISTSLLAQEDDWGLNHHFSITGDYLSYRRTHGHKKVFIYDTSSATVDSCNRCHFKKACITSQLMRQFDFKPGYRVALRYTAVEAAYEATFMHIVPWEGECGKSQDELLDFSLRNPDFFTDYTDADEAAVRYTTRFDSAELNGWDFVSSRRGDYISASWMLGLRYFYIPEKIDVAYGKNGNKSTGIIDINNQIGVFQAGLSLQWNPLKSLNWDLMMKGGGGVVWASEKNHFHDQNNTVTLFNIEAWDYGWPFFVDLSLSLGWQLVDWLNLHAAYQMIYLNGFATAPDQLVKHANPKPHIKFIGATTVYGLSGGITVSF